MTLRDMPDDDDRPEVIALFANLKAALPQLQALLDTYNGDWEYEDRVYRFYHQSFKVYDLQIATTSITQALQALAPERELHEWYRQIVSEGTVLDKPFKDVCQHLRLEKKVTPKAMRRTFQDLARRASVDGLIQRSICGHLTEEMTERYSSVAQVEVEAAVGKVISLAGYRDLLSERPGGCEMGVTPSPKDKEPIAAAPVSDRN